MKQYVLLAGGLGNQLFQYSAAVLRGASRVVFIDLIENERYDDAGKPEIMSLKLPVPVEFIEYPSRSKLLRKFFLWLLGSTARPISIRFRFASSSLILLVTSLIVRVCTRLSLRVEIENRLDPKLRSHNSRQSFLLIGYFQSLEGAKSIERNIGEIEILNPSETFIEYSKMLESEEMIGLHIRRGDYVNNPTFGNLSNVYFREILAKVQISRKRVIVFSDSTISIEEYVPPSILPFTIICPSTFTGFEILLLMSMCDDLVMSNSSLSWWAAYIGQRSGNCAYAPEPWFKSEVQSPNFYDPKWNRQSSVFT